MIKKVTFILALAFASIFTWAQNISVDNIKQHIEVLASDSLAGRVSNTEGGFKAARYIRGEIAKMGIAIVSDTIKYTNRRGQQSQLINCHTTFEGNDPKLKDEWIVLTAHYDHIGVDDHGSVYPGANDNATSVAALLEVVRNYKSSGRSLLVLFADAEELGLYGSMKFVNNPPVELSSIKLAVVCEMLGHLDDHNNVNFFGQDMFVEGQTLVNAIQAKQLKIVTQDEHQARYWGMSDCLAFWKSGIPVMVCFTPSMENIHQLSDTASSINVEGVAQIAEYLTRCIKVFGDAKVITPTDLAKKHCK